MEYNEVRPYTAPDCRPPAPVAVVLASGGSGSCLHEPYGHRVQVTQGRYSMAFRHAQCPSCKKAILVPDDAETSLCMYCGQAILIKETAPTAAESSIATLLTLGRAASAAGNCAEAESYFSRVLELDPTVSEAWAGKGRAAGWQSSLARIRFREVLVAFEQAIATASESERTATTQFCVSEVNALVANLYGMARKYLVEFIALPDTWVQYLQQCGQMLSALETARSWLPDDPTTLRSIVHLCKDNIEGIAYRDQFDNNAAKAWHLSQEYESQVRQELDSACKALHGIDPTYQAPTVQVSKPDKGGCFIVTATMGGPQHPTVCLMRTFRDQRILKTPGGRQFLSWYYRYGPIAAEVIRDRRWLRVLSYRLIVGPAAWAARRLVR